MSRLSTVTPLVCLLGVLCICTVGQSGVIRDDRDPQLYLDLGASPLLESVGRVNGTTSSSSFLASGTLIAEDWVLTAAHVVQGATSLEFTIGGTTYTGAGWAMNSKFNTRKLGAGYDIGLIHLGAPVTDIAPMVRYTGSDELGTTTLAAGFGMTGNGLTGATTLDLQKRAGENTADAFYPVRKGTPNVLLMDFDNPNSTSDNSYGSAAPLDLEYMIAPGDSGGGLFADFGSGLELIGVHSFAWGRLDGNPDSDYGDVSGHTRVSVFNTWIDDAIADLTGGGDSGGGKGNGKGNGKGKNANSSFDPDALGGYEYVSLDDIAAVPEPASLSILVVGALAIIRRRRT